MSHLTKFHQRQALWGIPETPPIPGVNYLYNHYKAAISGDPRPLPAENPTSRAAPGWMLFVNEAIWGRIGQHLNGYVRLVIMYIWLYICVCVSIYIYIFVCILYIYILYAVIWCIIILYIYTYTYIRKMMARSYRRWTSMWHLFAHLVLLQKPRTKNRNCGRSWKSAGFHHATMGEWIITNHIQLFPMDASTFLGSVWGIIYYDLEA